LARFELAFLGFADLDGDHDTISWHFDDADVPDVPRLRIVTSSDVTL